MQAVGQPGWFSRPRDKDVEADTAFGYLFSKDDGAKVPPIPKVGEAKKQDAKTSGEKLEVEQERNLWSDDEKRELAKIQSLEKGGVGLIEKIWDAVEDAFAATASS